MHERRALGPPSLFPTLEAPKPCVQDSCEYPLSPNVERATVIRPSLHRVFSGVGAALAVLTFASPLLESVHEANVRHVACPEDGELVEAPAQAPHQHAQASGDLAALFAERDPAAPASSGQGHHHCAVMLQAHLRAREQSHKRLAVAVLAAVAVASVPDESPQLRSVALYRIAPKASPPA
jgi:hypothetical protein